MGYIYENSNVLTPARTIEPTGQFDHIPVTPYWRQEAEERAKVREATVIAVKVKRFGETREEAVVRQQRAVANTPRVRKQKERSAKPIRKSFLNPMSLSKIQRRISDRTQGAREIVMAYLYAAHLEGRHVSTKEFGLIFPGTVENVVDTMSDQIEKAGWQEVIYIAKEYKNIRLLSKREDHPMRGVQRCKLNYLNGMGVSFMAKVYDNPEFKPLIDVMTPVVMLFTPIHKWGINVRSEAMKTPWPEELYRNNFSKIKSLVPGIYEIVKSRNVETNEVNF